MLFDSTIWVKLEILYMFLFGISPCSIGIADNLLPLSRLVDELIITILSDVMIAGAYPSQYHLLNHAPLSGAEEHVVHFS